LYLIDTNILIYHFNNSIPGKSKEKLRQIFRNYFNISIITKMEFPGFKGHSEETFKNAGLFLLYAQIIGLDNEIVDLVIELKRNKRIKLPDAIIAATSIKNNLILITRNIGDFKDINVKIYNPFD